MSNKGSEFYLVFIPPYYDSISLGIQLIYETTSNYPIMVSTYVDSDDDGPLIKPRVLTNENHFHIMMQIMFSKIERHCKLLLMIQPMKLW